MSGTARTKPATRARRKGTGAAAAVRTTAPAPTPRLRRSASGPASRATPGTTTASASASAPVPPDAAPVPTFVALDFETANPSRDSACALAVVRVEGGRVVAKKHWLIRPPTATFTFTDIHGITWNDVRRAPAFGEVWAEAVRLTAGAEFLAAHNAAFDRSVLRACCDLAGLAPPATPFECTVALARRALGIYPTKLPDVCRHLGIPLRHHDAMSDAEACARIVLAARSAGASGRA